MTCIGRSRRSRRGSWIGFLAYLPLAFIGCGGGGDPAPDAAASNAATAPDAGHAGPAGGPPGQPSGGYAGESSGSQSAHGVGGDVPTAAMAPHDAPAGMNGPPAGMYASSAGGQGDPNSSHGAASGAPGSPGGSHASPDYARLPPPGQESQAIPGYNSNAGTPGSANGSSNGTSQQKPSTESWLAGLAAGVLSDDAASPSIQPGAGGPEGGHAMAPGYEGGIPGNEYGGIPGAEGAGAQPAQEFDEGTAEHAAQQLVLKMQAGDMSGLDEIISERTTDKILAPLRDGTADADQLDSNKELVAGASLVMIRPSGGTKLFVVRTASGKVLTITTRREGEDYKVAGLKIDTPRGLRGR